MPSWIEGAVGSEGTGDSMSDPNNPAGSLEGNAEGYKTRRGKMQALASSSDLLSQQGATTRKEKREVSGLSSGYGVAKDRSAKELGSKKGQSTKNLPFFSKTRSGKAKEEESAKSNPKRAAMAPPPLPPPAKKKKPDMPNKTPLGKGRKLCHVCETVVGSPTRICPHCLANLPFKSQS